MFPLRDTEKSDSKPLVTILLIAINILVFLFEFSLDDRLRNLFIAAYGLVPENFHLQNVVTSMFLHGGWMHVLGNMWFLWIFGDNIEDALGHFKFLLFYLACGTVAALAQVFLSPYSNIPMVGASGAIAGVMGAYMVKFPRSRILTLFFFFFISVFEVPAWLMLVYWFGTQLLNGVGSIGETQANQGGVAFFAHVGGFLAGIALIKAMGTRERGWRRGDVYRR